MSQSELAIAGFYDYEQEQGTRRAPDWGGDDLFTTATMSRRRRFERSAHPARLRDTDEHRRSADPAPAPAPASEPVIREADPYLGPVPAGRRTVTVTGRPGAFAVAAPRAPSDGQRRRSRTIEERLVHQPERLVAWAFGMGLLLILLAILTAQ